MTEMRALFFLNSFHGGGTERVCLNLAKSLHELNIESDFIIVFKRADDYDIPSYIHVFSIELREPILTRFNIWKCVHKVNKFINGRNYVLITAHLNPAQYLASLTIVGKKTLYVMHAPLVNHKNIGYYRIKTKKFLKNKNIITVSKGLENELNHIYGIDIKNITTIYNPCDIRSPKKIMELVLPNKKPYILFMGRLEEVKNPQMALALYYKGQFYKNYNLIYLGKGSQENSLKKRIAELKMEENVFMVGFQKDPEQWLLHASLLLSCSKQEGFAMNIVEALICRTPVVAADCPYGPKEILVDELSEYLIYPEQEFNKSIAVITSALKAYPQITEKYYERFNDAVIIQNYLKTWNKCFGV